MRTSTGELHHCLSVVLSFHALSRASLQLCTECTAIHCPGSVYSWARDQCSQKTLSHICLFSGGLSRHWAWSTQHVHRVSSGIGPGLTVGNPEKISLPWECFSLIAPSGTFTEVCNSWNICYCIQLAMRCCIRWVVTLIQCGKVYAHATIKLVTFQQMSGHVQHDTCIMQEFYSAVVV